MKKHYLRDLGIIAICFLIVLNAAMFLKEREYKERLDVQKKGIGSSDMRKSETAEKCPDAKGGNVKAPVQIKYFYSEFCPWCQKEEPILQRLVEERGPLVHIEWYNINACPEQVDKYKVSGVPTFIFSSYRNETEYTHYGFVYEKDLRKLVCDVTGECRGQDD